MQNNSDFMNLFNELLPKIKRRLKKTFRANRERLISIGYDEDDLLSEVYLTMSDIFIKYKDLDKLEREKVINKSIGYKLSNIIARAYTEEKNVKKVDFWSDILYNYTNSEYSTDCLMRDYDTLLDNLDRKSRTILEMKVMKGYSLDKISRIVKMSKRGVAYSYNNSIRMLRKKVLRGE